MVVRFYIEGFVDVAVPFGLFVFLVTGASLAVVVIACLIREYNIRNFLKKRAERRQKLGKVK